MVNHELILEVSAQSETYHFYPPSQAEAIHIVILEFNRLTTYSPRGWVTGERNQIVVRSDLNTAEIHYLLEGGKINNCKR